MPAADDVTGPDAAATTLGRMELTSIGGLLGLVHLVIAVWAIVKIINSGASTVAKVLWILGVLAFPLVGLIVWFLAGPKG